MTFDLSDVLGSEPTSALDGSPLLLVDAARLGADAASTGMVVAVDREGRLPEIDPAICDGLITVRLDAPPPWFPVEPRRLEATLAVVSGLIGRCPVASVTLSRVLRIGEMLSFEAALELESLAYSTLLGGAEFRSWLAGTTRPRTSPTPQRAVRYDREGSVVTLTLASPGNRNAMTAPMRDALYEALANVLEDPTQPELVLQGEGRCFSTGGDLAEFGSATDLARAHVIRTERSSARLLFRIGERATARVHGACIGSGIEIPAAAARRTAHCDTFVQLPELRMGLIPGAGGTATLSRAVGRHRLFLLVAGAFQLRAPRALDWGLFHSIVS